MTSDDLPERMIWTTVHGSQEDSIRMLEAGAREIKRLRDLCESFAQDNERLLRAEAGRTVQTISLTSPVQTWERTSELRWRDNVLEQAYWSRETGETEWRAVRVVFGDRRP